MAYIIKLSEKVWIAPWIGDPGRTLLRQSAELFSTKKLDKQKLDNLKQKFPYINFESSTIEKY